MKTMSKVWTVLLMLAAVLLVTTPAEAQEVVTTPPDSLEAWIGYVVAAVLLLTFGFAAWVQHTTHARVQTLVDTLTVAIQELSASVPQGALRPGQELIQGGVDASYDYVRQRVTDRTPTLRDDELLDEAERRTENLLRGLGLMAGPIEHDADPDANVYSRMSFGQFGDETQQPTVADAVDADPNASLAGPESGQ